MKMVMRAPRRRKVKEEAPDPIVAFELRLWMALGKPVFVVFTDSVSVAREMCYDLASGPYTTKDFDFVPLRQSEVGVLKARWVNEQENQSW